MNVSSLGGYEDREKEHNKYTIMSEQEREVFKIRIQLLLLRLKDQ